MPLYSVHAVCPGSSYPILCSNLLYKMGHLLLGHIVPCVQEVVTPLYIVSYYIKWGNYFLDTQYSKYSIYYVPCISCMCEFLHMKHVPLTNEIQSLYL